MADSAITPRHAGNLRLDRQHAPLGYTGKENMGVGGVELARASHTYRSLASEQKLCAGTRA